MTKEIRKYAPFGVLISLIFLNIAYAMILIAGMQKPFGTLESIAYILEIVAVGLMIRYHVNRTGWIIAISGFILIILIKAYSLYHRGFFLHKEN